MTGVDGGKSRVVVTGLGAVTPVGNTARDFWAAVCEGRSGIGPITAFDASRLDARIAGEVKGFDPRKYIDKKEVKKMDRFIQFAVAAGADAVDDAKVDWDHVDPARAGCLVGSGIGGILSILEWHKVLLERGPGRMSPVLHPGRDREHGVRAALDPLPAEGPELRGGHRLRHRQPRHRRRLPADPAGRGRRHAGRRRRRRRSTSCAWRASARCGRSRPATTRPSAPRVPSTPTVTGSCAARGPACSCSRAWSTRAAAGRGSTPRWWATA